MSDIKGETRTSVPAVPLGKPKAPLLALQPSLLAERGRWWGAAVLFAIGYSVGGLIWGIDPDPNQYVAASYWNDWTVRLEDVSCVSVKHMMLNGKPYSDPDLTQAITDILKIKTVLGGDDTTCPWGLSGSAESRIETAIAYNGHWSRHLVPLGICEIGADGQMNASRCFSRQVHVFTPRVSPHNLFRIGLTGMARAQEREFEAFQMSK